MELPYDILCPVFDLLAEADCSHASLVCREWRGPAQEALWRVLRVESQKRAQALLATPSRGATRNMLLAGGRVAGGVSSSAATRLLARCNGVRKLELRDFKHLSWRALAGLEGLQHLSLRTGFPDSLLRSQEICVPFRLHRLSLHQCPVSAPLVDALFRASSDTLRILDVSLLPSSPGYVGLVRSFHCVAPTLDTLALHHRASPALITELVNCEQLRFLSCHAAVPLLEVLDHLPSPLERLTIELDWDAEDVLAGLVARFPTPSLSRLKTLALPRSAVKTAGLQGVDFVAACAAQGIWLDLSR